MSRKRKKQKEGKWDWVLDIIFTVPELIIAFIRIIIRGILSVIRSW
ncbi:hypothetical protein [Oceanobacillus halotolerans]|nr:hypothetical protein [Oceanobacillus halotolerans]